MPCGKRDRAVFLSMVDCDTDADKNISEMFWLVDRY